MSYIYRPDQVRFGKENLKTQKREWFVHNGANIFIEYDQPSGGGFTAKAVNVPGPGTDQHLARFDVNENKYALYLNNAIGSTHEIVDSTGSVLNLEMTTPWGKDLPGFTFNNAVPNRYGLTGQQRDRETASYSDPTGEMHYRARGYSPRQMRFLQNDPIIGNRPTEHYGYASNNPVTRADPSGLDDLYVRGDVAYWVSEKEGFWWADEDIRETYIGMVSGGQISLSAEFGGGQISVEKARGLARGGIYSGYATDFWSRGIINGALTGSMYLTRPQGSLWGAAASGAGEGLQGGGSILSNTVTFGGTDWAGITDSEQYQGAEYTVSRIGSVMAREAAIAILTAGVGNVAMGGGRFAYGAAQLGRGMRLMEAGTGGYQMGTGIQDVAGGDASGWLDILGGGLRVGGVFLNGGSATSAFKASGGRAAGAGGKGGQGLIDDILGNELAGVRMTYKPTYDPALTKYGVSFFRQGTRVGHKSVAAGRLETMDTLLCPSGKRAWSGIPDGAAGRVGGYVDPAAPSARR